MQENQFGRAVETRQHDSFNGDCDFSIFQAA